MDDLAARGCCTDRTWGCVGARSRTPSSARVSPCRSRCGKAISNYLKPVLNAPAFAGQCRLKAVDARVESSWFKRLKIMYGRWPTWLKFASDFNLRRYIKVLSVDMQRDRIGLALA